MFTREQVGTNWNFIAGAWECIPSRPEAAITKRVEFGYQSWNAGPLLDCLVVDDSYGMHPRFVTVEVDSGEKNYALNLFDINYKTWEVRRIWQDRSQLFAFGLMSNSIFCRSTNGWLLLDAASGTLSKNVPFTPIETDGDYWLVRKMGETEGCWSYDRVRGQYIAHFGPVDEPEVGYSQSRLSPDGRNRAWVLVPMADGWRGGAIAGRLILQRDGGKEEISVPIEVWAVAGSGVPVIPRDIEMTFFPDGQFQFRARKGKDKAEDRIWNIDIATGTVSSGVARHFSTLENASAALDGVRVPDYLRRYVGELRHFGRSGLAPAFLLHMGIIRKLPEYADCTAGVSRTGRHVLYRAKKGPLTGVYIYGDLVTKQTVRWKSPNGLDSKDAQEFVWVETPN